MVLDSLYRFDGSIVDILKYTSLLLTLLGLLGNSFSLLTVTSRHCKKSSFTVYLSALAVVDSFLLAISLIETWIFTVYNVDLTLYGGFTCKFIIFFECLLTAMSSWLVIAITVERTAATVYPHRFKQVHSVRSGIKIIGILLAVMTLVAVHILYGIEFDYVEQRPYCVYIDGAYQYFKRRFIVVIDSVVFIISPIFIITIGNIVTVVKVRQSGKQIAPVTSHVQADKKASRHLVIITLLISVSFLIFTMPACVYFLICRSVFNDSNDAERQIGFAAVTTLLRLNYSTNFFLYVLSGHRFRKLFRTAISCKQSVHPSLSTSGSGVKPDVKTTRVITVTSVE